ncbi:hypothetical protein EZV62_022357 [Acer yangbiense]|uniref:CCHC-type domain-containing protein n=1 Tax=Acer yangbiense TaxID=1000413 RepID=A0A5C7H853_9ROSI|nr:hypothetical protein EZV62_022357 [Acer yangbiense]
MDSKIAKLYENLSIADEDMAIHEPAEEAQVDGVAEVNHCLVGKVLSGKRVNREAFKMLIDQLWSPFGAVDTELVGDNIFMFYFNNQVDRDRIWQRGPWYFEKSLVALEKPTGIGNIALLAFNKVELWVQIHEVPIMCMNRRMAKWMAEQIGEVIDIPSESKECWGRYLRVNVQIDIHRPLKRWLRLKLDKTDNIVVVGLKYERLPEFCYACGKIGHGIKECLDLEARTEALSGKTTKFGLLMRASILERQRNKNSSFTNGSSIEKERSLEGSRVVEIENSLNTKPESFYSQKKAAANSSETQRRSTEETSSKTLAIVNGPRPKPISKPCLVGPTEGNTNHTIIMSNGDKTAHLEEDWKTTEASDNLAQETNFAVTDSNSTQPVPSDMIISPKKKSNRKWKRSAREVVTQQFPGKILSPLRQVLALGKVVKKASRDKKPSSPGLKLSGIISKGKSPLKITITSKKNPKVEEPYPNFLSEPSSLACKRKPVGNNDRPQLEGSGNPRAFAALSRLLKKYSPDFVFLSETKVSGKKASRIKESLHFGDGFSVDSDGQSGGLMLLWKKDLMVTIVSFSVGHIDACIQMDDGFRWPFLGFYSDPVSSKRPCSWALLRRLRDVNNLPWGLSSLGTIEEMAGEMCKKDWIVFWPTLLVRTSFIKQVWNILGLILQIIGLFS